MDTMPSPAAPRAASRETGRTRTVRFIVWSLDVWGHSPSECHEHGCKPCCHIDTDGDGNDSVEHDDDRCECHYEVNDRCRVGRLSVVETEMEHNVGTSYAFTSWACSEDAIRAALVDGGFVKAEMRERIGFDDSADYGGDEWIEDAETGRPEFQLERERPEDEEESAE